MPTWTKEQNEAIHKSGTNIIVSAGAGSGKTAVLTERVIEKLKQGIKINELLILTFTNAAAGEMKDRIRKKINEHQELVSNLDLIDASYITTFDSYTMSLVKKYNYLLNVSPNLSIIDTNLINIIKNEYIDKIFDEYYENNDAKFTKFIKDNTIKNDKSIKKAIIKIYNSLELKIDKEEYLNNYINNNFKDEIIDKYITEFTNLIKEEINNIETNLIYISESDYKEYSTNLNNAYDKLLKANDYDEIFKHIEIPLIRRPRGSEDIKIYKDNIDSSVKIIKSYLRFRNVNEIKESFQIMKEYVEIIIDILLKLEYMIKDYKNYHDLYEFTDIELMAIKLLQENAEIREEIKSFYQEICIDEYQDTNDLQEEFIKLIENNNVYMVGDIKQSIYGFRNAKPAIFQNKYDRYSKLDGGIKIDLLKNFRSRNSVLNGINKIFSHIMDNTLGGADYKNGHIMLFGNNIYEENKNENQNNELEILNYQYEDKIYSKEELEGFIIGHDIIKKINDKYVVLDKKTNKLRPCQYEDFCIIMDRGTSFMTYNKIFEYLGIPLQINEDKTLTNEIDLLLIKNILSLVLKVKTTIIDQEFKYYFMSIGRSFLYEYSDNYLLKLFYNNDFSQDDIYNKVKYLSQKIDTSSPYEMIKLIIDTFNFYEKMIKIGNIEEGIIRINHIYDIAKNIGNVGYDIYKFQEYLEQILEDKLDIKYRNNNSSSSSVKIMNIHNSKGLEFPICYFSGYHKEFNTMDIKDKFIYDEKYGIITPFFMDGTGTSILKDLVKDKYYKNNIAEEIRLFYVALTRCKEKIIIVTSLDDNENTVRNVVDYNIRRKYNSFLSMLNSIRGNLKEYITNIDIDRIQLTKDYLSNDKNIKLEKKETKKINYQTINILNNDIDNLQASKEINELISSDEYKKLEYGTKMHKILEEADFHNIDNNLEYSDLIKRFVQKLKINKNTLIFKEHEFIFDDKDNSYHGIIDLVLIDDDIIKIVDYKLKNIADENYIKQLNIYYKYLKNIFSRKIEMYLYSIVDDELKEIKVVEEVEV